MTPFMVLGELLDDLLESLIAIGPNQYVARPVPGVSGSIGEHVRHTLDHIAALLKADGCEPLSYDHRQRGTAAETNLHAAVEQIFHLMALVERHSKRSLDEQLQVTARLSTAGDELTSWSTLGRELAFVASHTIHHQAQIALLLAIQGIHVPRRFGYAPSTPLAQ
jgi:uncharacterized damage-inducible protein DinB